MSIIAQQKEDISNAIETVDKLLNDITNNLQSLYDKVSFVHDGKYVEGMHSKIIDYEKAIENLRGIDIQKEIYRIPTTFYRAKENEINEGAMMGILNRMVDKNAVLDDISYDLYTCYNIAKDYYKWLISNNNEISKFQKEYIMAYEKTISIVNKDNDVIVDFTYQVSFTRNLINELHELYEGKEVIPVIPEVDFVDNQVLLEQNKKDNWKAMADTKERPHNAIDNPDVHSYSGNPIEFFATQIKETD